MSWWILNKVMQRCDFSCKIAKEQVKSRLASRNCRLGNAAASQDQGVMYIVIIATFSRSKFDCRSST